MLQKNLENLEYARKSWKLLDYLNHHFFQEHERCLINVGPCILNNSKLRVHPCKTKIHATYRLAA